MMNNRRHLFPSDDKAAHDITVTHILPYLEQRDLKSTSRVCKKLKADTEKYISRIRRLDLRYREKEEELRATKAAALHRRARRGIEEREQIAAIKADFDVQKIAAIQVVQERWRQVEEEAEKEEEIWQQEIKEEYAYDKKRDVPLEMIILDQRIKLLDKFLRQITAERENKSWLSGRVSTPFYPITILLLGAAEASLLAAVIGKMIGLPANIIFLLIQIGCAVEVIAVVSSTVCVRLHEWLAPQSLAQLRVGGFSGFDRGGIERFDNYFLSSFSSQLREDIREIQDSFSTLDPNPFATINVNTARVREVCELIEAERQQLLTRKAEAQRALEGETPSVSSPPTLREQKRSRDDITYPASTESERKGSRKGNFGLLSFLFSPHREDSFLEEEEIISKGRNEGAKVKEIPITGPSSKDEDTKIEILIRDTKFKS